MWINSGLTPRSNGSGGLTAGIGHVEVVPMGKSWMFYARTCVECLKNNTHKNNKTCSINLTQVCGEV